MAQDWYIGIGGKARRVVAAYVGVGGKARAITAGYVGIGGKARQFWGSGRFEIGGLLTNKPRGTFYDGVGLTNHAIFFANNDSYADAYDKNLVRSSLQNGSNETDAAGARAGNYCVIGYGILDNDGHTYAYNDNLVKSTGPSFNNFYHTDMEGASAGNGSVAYIGFGRHSSSEAARVGRFDSNLVYKNINDGSDSRCDPSSLDFGQYAIFWGGVDKQSDGDVNSKSYDYSVFNASGVVKHASMGRVARSGTSTAVAGGKYAVFVGGSTSGSSGRTYVDTLDSNLVKTEREDMPFSVYYAVDGDCGETAGNHAVFVYDKQYIFYYDKNLVRTIENSTLLDSPYATASLGNMAIYLRSTNGLSIKG